MKNGPKELICPHEKTCTNLPKDTLGAIGLTYQAKYSVFAFNALQRYSIFYLIMNNLNYINCTLFNRELL